MLLPRETELGPSATIRRLSEAVDRLAGAERAEALAALVTELVQVSRLPDAHARAGELAELLELRTLSRPAVWFWTLLFWLFWRPGRSDRLLRALLRIAMWRRSSANAPRATFELARAAQFPVFWYDIRRCRALSLNMMALATTPAQVRAALCLLGFAHGCQGRGRVGIPTLRRALYAMHCAGDRDGLKQYYPFLAISYHHNRQPERARRIHYLFLHHYADDRFYRLVSMTSLQSALFAAGEFGELRQLIDRCFNECFALDQSRHHLQVYGWHAVLLAAEGRAEEAEESLTTARRAASHTDNHLDWTIYGRLAAVTFTLLGKRQQALACIAEATPHCTTYGEPLYYKQELLQLTQLNTGGARLPSAASVYGAHLFGAAVQYANGQQRALARRNVESNLSSLSGRLSQSLSSAFGFHPDREVGDEELRVALERAFSTHYVVTARDLDGLRRKAMQELHIDTIASSAEHGDEVRLVCPGGGLFVGYPCPQTVEVGEELAVGILLYNLDIVSESLVRAALRMVLAQYVFVRSIRVSRESYAAEKRAAALGRLTRMFAHDVRQPFAILKLAMDSLRHTESAEEFAQISGEFLTEIDRSVAAVDGLIQDVLEIESRDRPRCEQESPRSLIRAALNQVVQAHPNVPLTFRYDMRHWRSVRVDGVKVLRVFANLLTNAVEAMPTGGTIWVRTRDVEREGRDEVEFTIGNSGSRIPREDMERIFDPLYTRGKPGGTGLGLAIAHKIVAAHGGQIWCEPEVEDGVEFRLTLPAGPFETWRDGPVLPGDSRAIVHTFQFLRAHQEAENPPQASDSMLLDAFRKRADHLERKIVLVVIDDEPVYRNWLLGQLARKEGLADLVVARAAGSTGEFFADENWADGDLFIIDVDLNEDQTGLDLVRKVRAANPHALITVHSNCSAPEDFHGAADAGADAFLPKPMSRAHLLRLLTHACDGCGIGHNDHTDYTHDTEYDATDTQLE